MNNLSLFELCGVVDIFVFKGVDELFGGWWFDYLKFYGFKGIGYVELLVSNCWFIDYDVMMVWIVVVYFYVGDLIGLVIGLLINLVLVLCVEFVLLRLLCWLVIMGGMFDG